MSADLLREAAALMRERAELAPPSPWKADVRSNGRAWLDVGDEPHAWGMHGWPAAAAHVASWHPAVALAVADWLMVAVRLLPLLPPGIRDKALAVARAYLGRDA